MQRTHHQRPDKKGKTSMNTILDIKDAFDLRMRLTGNQKTEI